MSTQAKPSERMTRILAILALLLMLLPTVAVAAPAAPMGTGDVSTVTIHSPLTAAPAYYPAGLNAAVAITFTTDGDSATGLGEVFWQVGSMTSLSQFVALPIINQTFIFPVPAASASGMKDVRVCARGPGQGGQICAPLQTNAVQFITAAPPSPQGPRWPIHGETLINPNKVGGIYDVLESIPSPTPPNPTFLVTWDAVKAAAVPNLGATPITLELWDTTDYNAVPPNCKLYGQLGVDGTGTPTGMILRWSSAWTAPGGLPNTGNYTWAVPPTLGSCFMMRLIVADMAGQRGWDWSGPVPAAPSTDPDPLTGRFQITAYDLTAPNVTWQSPAANACIGGARLLGPFTVNANDPESGIDWVFFQAKWPTGTSTFVSPPFPSPLLPAWPGLPWFLYTQPEPPGTYVGSVPVGGLPAGTPFDVEVTARNMAGNTTSQTITGLVWANPATLAPFVFDPTCSALNPPCQPSALGNYSFISGDRQIKGTVLEAFNGEVMAVHFAWQPMDILGNDVGAPMPIGDGVRTAGLPAAWPGNSEWTLDWDTTLFPDGPGYIIATVENCAGATKISDSKGVNRCPTYILNAGPTCAADAIQTPAFGDTWQIGQGWQWVLPPAVVGGNANGLILWDPNKIQGVFPAPMGGGGPPIPVYGQGPISNIEVSWDNGAHWFRILMDGTFWPNDPMYQTSVAPGATSYAGYPWLYVHGRPNEPLSWRVRLTATDVAGNQCTTESRPFNVFGREEQVGTGCGPTFPTSTPWPAAIAPPLGSCTWAAPVLTSQNPSPWAGTEVLNVSAWDPQTGISKVSWCYETPGTPATATSPAGWTCPNSTDVPRALQGSFSGPYNYRTAFDTTMMPDGPNKLKAIVCNGVGMCVDTNELQQIVVDNTAPAIVNMWPRSYQTIATNVLVGGNPSYCARFSPNDPPTDLTPPVTTKFEYSLDGGATWVPAGSAAVAGTNTGCSASQGRLPADDPLTGPLEFLPDGTIMQVRGMATDALGNASAWLTHYMVKVDNQFPDTVLGPFTLTPGWNLVSLPLPPAQPLIVPAEGVLHGVLKDLEDCGVKYQVHAYGNPLGSYNVPNGWSVYDPVGLQTLAEVKDGAGFWVWVDAACPVYNFGIYPPRPTGTLPAVYQAGKNWNLMGYTDATGVGNKTVAQYFGADIAAANPPGPTAIYTYAGGSWSIPALASNLVPSRGFWVAYLDGRAITP